MVIVLATRDGKISVFKGAEVKLIATLGVTNSTVIPCKEKTILASSFVNLLIENI